MSSIKRDEFFTKTKCDRCPNDLAFRQLSWFNEDVLCRVCVSKESMLKKSLFARGEDLAALEGCGYIPKVEAIEDITG